ncbi:MAG: sugar transferase, partial [Mycobacteriales bacterium]
LAAATPLWVAISLAIKLEDGGPVFYRGLRVGKDGELFRMWKFRTMVVDAESLGGSSTPDDDPRLTRIGRSLRRSKLDELPQLLNVLAGDMSLVGPRPQVFWDVQRYTPDERRILEVKPGMTDWASLAFRNEGEILCGSVNPDEAYDRLIRPEKLRLELAYRDLMSPITDIKIIARTVVTMLGGRGQRG